jgi:hypothetical protein
VGHLLAILPMMITPQVGMPVLYHPHPDDHFGAGTPLAAVITHVWSDSMVNLVIFDQNGLAQNRTSILLRHDAHLMPQVSVARTCEYPEWFARLMAPPMLIDVGALPPIDDRDLMPDKIWCLSPARAPSMVLPVCEPAGCQPTSQVLG